jgi:hypothetical protein
VIAPSRGKRRKIPRATDVRRVRKGDIDGRGIAKIEGLALDREIRHIETQGTIQGVQIRDPVAVSPLTEKLCGREGQDHHDTEDRDDGDDNEELYERKGLVRPAPRDSRGEGESFFFAVIPAQAGIHTNRNIFFIKRYGFRGKPGMTRGRRSLMHNVHYTTQKGVRLVRIEIRFREK